MHSHADMLAYAWRAGMASNKAAPPLPARTGRAPSAASLSLAHGMDASGASKGPTQPPRTDTGRNASGDGASGRYAACKGLKDISWSPTCHACQLKLVSNAVQSMSGWQERISLSPRWRCLSMRGSLPYSIEAKKKTTSFHCPAGCHEDC